jgi:hypothetical protein
MCSASDNSCPKEKPRPLGGAAAGIGNPQRDAFEPRVRVRVG